LNRRGKIIVFIGIIARKEIEIISKEEREKFIVGRGMKN
jgi:hypothetical protein